MNIPPILDLARRYTRAGLSVIPIKADGSKGPALPSWKEYQSKIASSQQIDFWFSKPRPIGLAIVTGTVSGGLMVIDFETEKSWSDWYKQAVEVIPPGYLDTAPFARTPKGGRHLYLRIPGVVRNTKLAKNPDGTTLIETRGEGGYVLAPGSDAACHSTGNTYEWVRRGWIQ